MAFSSSNASTLAREYSESYEVVGSQRRRRDLEELIRRVVIHTTCDTTQVSNTAITSQVHRKILNKLKPDETTAPAMANSEGLLGCPRATRSLRLALRPRWRHFSSRRTKRR